MPKRKAAPPVEGLLLMSTEQSKAAGVAIATAAPGRIQTSVALPGEIRFNEDRTAHVVPRLAGVVEAVHADLGQLVKKGQVLAVIASTDLSEQRSELLSAQRRLSLARATYEREKMLWQEKISAELDYLQARQAWREADIAVQNAQQKLQALGAVNAWQGASEPLRDPRAVRRHGAGKTHHAGRSGQGRREYLCHLRPVDRVGRNRRAGQGPGHRAGRTARCW